MEIPSNASNIQPYGSPNGIKIASDEGSSASSISRLKEATSYGKVEKSKEEATEAAIQLAQERKELNDEERVKMVEKVNEFISSLNKGVAFKVDEESGRDVVTIYETTTGDIIRQIPDEEMLEILRRLAAQNSNSRIFEVKV
ncbi:Protein FlaG [Vibrio chagasii]|jgi:flagellar protein FlaG|uniref:flagellar protein FlaG n=1 Tax=Vibrio TaxID=662 RepID=UPI00015300B2|nr:MULTISPECIES: flagellar protein FlaG [Vibrio]EDK29484.1 flagellar protein FlaG [Vibrionales bacterium SWAT-3]MDE9382342.1 flagellar protein FlaG [Vibrio alginolyticus]MCG9564301.1 flagellar protein FlaG [Vibrio chagasii]MCG9567463.1 flagellar protein FlaG [Vibrio chagasii]MCG9603690.1 flagellar protein FlaG [Vibrio chagasii]|tara:strand:- start:97 stop:522 length:426 start_codon:yes stop_codon:yes gene_type:complete